MGKFRSHLPPPNYLRFAFVLAITGLVSADAQVFGPNLIVDDDAETGPGSQNAQQASIPVWTNKGANVIVYSSGYGLSAGSILPTNVGKKTSRAGRRIRH